MARLRGHSVLDASRALYVKRAPLTIGGRTFAKGDAFPWRDLGVRPKKLHQLWSQRVIGHEQPGERNGAESQNELVRPIVEEPGPIVEEPGPIVEEPEPTPKQRKRRRAE